MLGEEGIQEVREAMKKINKLEILASLRFVIKIHKFCF